MSRKSLVLLVVVTLTLGLAVGVSLAVEKGAADMTLKTEAAKKPAIFPHGKHQETKSCGVCHHTEVDGKAVPSEDGSNIAKCETCHNSDFGNEALNSFKKVAHKLCKGCHTKNKDAGAPTKCTGCHPKKK
jgi:predicted CXXCH cytochrome family protein